jgi:hypothetical protein
MLAAHPEFARAVLIEITAAGPRALARRDAVHERFAGQLATGHARLRAQLGAPELPPVAYRACVGAVHELVTTHVVEHGAERLIELLDPVVHVQLALLLGYAEAQRLAAGH